MARVDPSDLLLIAGVDPTDLLLVAGIDPTNLKKRHEGRQRATGGTAGDSSLPLEKRPAASAAAAAAHVGFRCLLLLAGVSTH